MSEVYYKVLGTHRRPYHGGTGQWKPHGWMPEIKNIELCERGYHLVTRDQLVYWLGPEIWTAYGRGEHIADDNKHVFGQARLGKRFKAWNARTQRLFACDCTEHILPQFEQRHPGDERPRNTIEVARNYANGKATKEELHAAYAAAYAAYAADADAAYAAAAAAAYAAYADAAYAAAAYAAYASAYAERAWQTERLFEYLEGGK